MRIVRLALLMSATTLAGCGTPSINGATGLSAALPGPTCAVRSTTRVGQRWVDSTTERGIAALGWQRPRAWCADPKPMVVKAPAAPPAGQVIDPAPQTAPRVETKVIPQQVDPPKPKPTRAECTARADNIKWETAIGKYWRKGRWTWIRKCMRGEV